MAQQAEENPPQTRRNSLLGKLVPPVSVFALSLFGVIAAIWAVVISFGSALEAVQTINSVFAFVKWWLALLLSAVILGFYLFQKKKKKGKLSRPNLWWGLMALPWVPVLAPLFLPGVTAAERFHIAIVIDSSARMTESFEGSASKWEVAQSATTQYLEKQPPEAAYSLFVVGGDSPGQSDCAGPASAQVAWEPGNLKLVIDAVANLQPGGSGSLTSALTAARNALLEWPAEDIRSVYIVVGGPDVCASQDHLEANYDPWEDFLDCVEDIFKPIGANIHTDLIVLVSEDVKDDLEQTYEIVRLKELGVILASNQQEVKDAVAAASNRAQDRYQELVAEDSPKPAAAIPPQSPATVSLPATAPIALQVAGTPLPDTELPDTSLPAASRTATFTPLPTATCTRTPLPPTLPPTYTPTNPPTFTPTDTPTDTPTATLAYTPTDFPENLLILAPNEGQDFSCTSDEDCVITVTVQWVPDAQTNGRYLSIWVRPLPDQEDQLYFAQQAPEYIGDGRWQSDQVYLGQIGDEPGTPFRIFALVTYQVYDKGDELPALPAYLMMDEVNVTR